MQKQSLIDASPSLLMQLQLQFMCLYPSKMQPKISVILPAKWYESIKIIEIRLIHASSKTGIDYTETF